MWTTIKNRFKPNIQPMNCIYINKSDLIYNYKYLQSLKPNAEIFPVLKSNAYGHWIDQILEIYKWLPIPYIVVDSFPEYNIVRRHSKFNILLLWETLSENYKSFDFDRTAFCVYNLETLHALTKLNKKIRIHLFLNTWMNREWIDPDLLPNALEFLKNYPKIIIEWVMSHLFSANKLDIDRQIEAFKMMYHQIIDYWHTPKYRHIWASIWLLKLNDDFFNAYRPWLALYGYNPLSSEDSDFDLWEKLEPALSLSSVVSAINRVSYNEWVSYDPQRKQLEKSDKITITIPFGYAEWMPRSAREKIEINHEKGALKQIWNICMNLSCYQWNEKVLIWDKVWILEKDQNSVWSISGWANAVNTIPYEILVHLDKWIRREIVE